MHDHFIFSTTAKFSRAKANRINSRIKAIDPSAHFVGPITVPGFTATGWIARPNDGINDVPHVAERNRMMADIAREVLGQ